MVSKKRKITIANRKKKEIAKQNEEVMNIEEVEIIDEKEENGTIRKKESIEEKEETIKSDKINEIKDQNNTQNKEITQVNTIECPYLGTINRTKLDFDFEKLCSISLTNLHVYACLVCGTYFQGVGKNTHAYKHSLEKKHYVFINLETCKAYCVPDNYEIKDASLDDIKYYLKPSFTKKEIEEMCYTSSVEKSLDGLEFVPGCVGLNNLKNTDFFNVIIQLVCVIAPLRNVLLAYQNREHNAKNLFIVLSELIKKIYNPKNFKGVVSPHEFLQMVGSESNKIFKIGTKSDPLEFLAWLLNKIKHYSDRYYGRIKKSKTTKRKWKEIEKGDEEIKKETNVLTDSVKNEEIDEIKWTYELENIVDYCLDGKLIITKQKGNDGEEKEKEQNLNSSLINESNNNNNIMDQTGTTKTIHFRTLTLPLPTSPVFKNSNDSNSIPQVSIFDLLTKFNGETESILGEDKQPSTMMISKLPKYLIFNIKRFTKNNFFIEKNGTIVNFVIKNLDMKEYIHPDYIDKNPITRYDLIANIYHVGTVKDGSYKIQILNRSNEEWYEIEDLRVTNILPQMVLLPESCILMFQRKDIQLNGEVSSTRNMQE